jgi:hypothetical protein
MVHEKSKHLLAEVYRGRLDGDIGDTAAFSDVYTMKRMSKEHPGKTAASANVSGGGMGPFEFVSESNMDFENYKNRPEFSDEHGGEGSLYGGSAIGRPDTPGSLWGRDAASSNNSDRGRSTSRDSERTMRDDPGVLYPAGYHQTPSALREYSPSPSLDLRGVDSRESPYEIGDQGRLVSGAAPMGVGHGQQQQQYTPYSPSRDGARDYFAR